MIIFLAGLIFAGLGYYIAQQKGRPETEGLILGLLFGPLGCLIESMLPSIERKKRPTISQGRGRSRPFASGTPEYREGWEAPPPDPVEDPIEAQVLDFLNASGGQPSEKIDMEAIARAAHRRAEKGER